MVTFAPSIALAATDTEPVPFHLFDIVNERHLMERHLRPIDADRYNHDWEVRGVPTRWIRIRAA